LFVGPVALRFGSCKERCTLWVLSGQLHGKIGEINIIICVISGRYVVLAVENGLVLVVAVAAAVGSFVLNAVSGLLLLLVPGSVVVILGALLWLSH
jgi:hypothetical protein